jgi:hypothetical protein
MAMTNSVLKFLGEQFTAADKTWMYLKNEAAADTLTWDKFFTSTSKFWIGSLERFWDLWPFAEGTPVAYGTVGSGATNYNGTPLAVDPIPANKLPVAHTFIRIKATDPAATGVPAPAVNPDGTLTIDVGGLTKLTAGDLFLVVVHYSLTGGGIKTVAVLVLSVI